MKTNPFVGQTETLLLNYQKKIHKFNDSKKLTKETFKAKSFIDRTAVFGKRNKLTPPSIGRVSNKKRIFC